MNYWLITTEFPPIHGGGISTYCWHTAKMMAEEGHVVTVFINDYSVKTDTIEKVLKNLSVIRFNPNQVEIGKALGYDARLSLEFAHIIEKQIEKEGIPDILETQDYSGIGYYILQKKHLLYPNFKDLNVVLTLHAPSFLYLDYNQVPLYNFPEYWTGEMEKASIRMADLVVSPSNYLVSELTPRMNLGEKKPLRIFNPFLNEWTTGEIPTYEKGDMVFFGKLTPQKGALEMLSYLKTMWDDGFDKPITIIGGGSHLFYPLGEDMIDFIKKTYSAYIMKGLIRFEGNMPPLKLKERLKKAHVVIIPSIVDNLPYTVLEVMSIGKVVLSSSNGGHTEILNHGESGFVFEHSAKGSFEKELLSILKKDPSEMERIGKNAQNAVGELTNYKVIYKEKHQELVNLIKRNTSKTEFPFIEDITRKKNEVVSLDDTSNTMLSIVIPYYNMGDFLEDTLQSLKNITYKPTEIIVVNDGSTDVESVTKLKGLEKKYNIIVYHKTNEGLSLTRNFGAAKAKGEFLAFLDADDMVSPDYYRRAIDVLKHYENVSFVGCWAQYFGESNDVWPTFNPEPPYLLTHNMINSSALIYKKDDFLSFGKNDPQMIYGMEDYDSVISMVKNGARGVSFPELWWQYRIRKNSMAQSFTKNKELYLYHIISKKHKAFINQYGSEIINLLNHNGAGIYFNNPTWEKGNSPSGFLSPKIKSLIKKNIVIRHFAKKVYRFLNK